VTDINKPQTVNGYIARMDVSNAYKEGLVNAYGHYVEYNNLQWERPIYKRAERLPNVPTTEQANKIISNSGKKYSMIFSILRDTGLRPIELHRTTQTNIDLDKGIIYPSTAKGGSARALKLKSSTLAMFKDYILQNNFGMHEKIFPNTNRMTHVWCRVRNRTAKKLKEPQLKKFRLYDLRHYFGTMLYHRTKDILYVKRQMGHKIIEHTLIYTHLVNFADDEFTARTAKTTTEALKLIEAGFEYVTEMDAIKLFRKRK
jgi:integrase